MTGKDGRFLFDNLSEGKLLLRFEAKGYAPSPGVSAVPIQREGLTSIDLPLKLEGNEVLVAA